MFFWDVSLGDVNISMPWYCETIPGMRELHSVRSKDMGDIFSIKHESMRVSVNSASRPMEWGLIIA